MMASKTQKRHFDPLIPIIGSFRPASYRSKLYLCNKQQQEQMVMLMGETLSIPSVAFRYQNVYGPGQSLSNPYTGILSIFSIALLIFSLEAAKLNLT